jgi:hypothetical protein
MKNPSVVKRASSPKNERSPLSAGGSAGQSATLADKHGVVQTIFSVLPALNASIAVRMTLTD